MKPTYRTKPINNGRCDTCRAEFSAGNAVGMAAQHAARNPDHYVYVERTRIYVWDPDGGPRLAAAPATLHRQSALTEAQL